MSALPLRVSPLDSSWVCQTADIPAIHAKRYPLRPMTHPLRLPCLPAGKKPGSRIAGDNEVSTKQVLQDPQAPLLGLLQGSTHAHTRKLPGVVDNRWGGNKFWDRLLGSSVKQQGTPLKHVHTQTAD